MSSPNDFGLNQLGQSTTTTWRAFHHQSYRILCNTSASARATVEEEAFSWLCVQSINRTAAFIHLQKDASIRPLPSLAVRLHEVRVLFVLEFRIVVFVRSIGWLDL